MGGIPLPDLPRARFARTLLLSYTEVYIPILVGWLTWLASLAGMEIEFSWGGGVSHPLLPRARFARTYVPQNLHSHSSRPVNVARFARWDGNRVFAGGIFPQTPGFASLKLMFHRIHIPILDGWLTWLLRALGWKSIVVLPTEKTLVLRRVCPYRSLPFYIDIASLYDLRTGVRN